MPKPSETILHELIQSMSMSEKRYFKLFAKQHSSIKYDNSRYIQLFDAIDKQLVYNETEIRETIYKGSNEERARKLKVTKTRLKSFVLRSLRSYYDSGNKVSSEYSMMLLLQEVEIYYRKALYTGCKKKLKEIRVIALKKEAYGILQEVIRWERKVLYAELDIAYLKQNQQRLFSDVAQSSLLLENKAAYWNLFFDLLLYLRRSVSLRTEEEINAIARLLEHPLLQASSKALSKESKIFYYYTKALHAHISGKHQQAFNENTTLIKFMRANIETLKEDSSLYVSILNNLVSNCFYLKKFKEADIFLELLKNAPRTRLDSEIGIITRYYQNKLILCSIRGLFEEGVQLVHEIEKTNKKLKKRILPATFDYYYAMMYFGTNQIGMALEYFDNLVNVTRTDIREDTQSVAKIMTLLCHYELNNYLFLESSNRTARYFLQQRNYLGNPEKLLLQFLKNTPNITSKKEEKELLIQLREALLNTTEAKEEQGFFQFFRIIDWLDGKIQDRPFGKIVQEAVG